MTRNTPSQESLKLLNKVNLILNKLGNQADIEYSIFT